MNSALPMRQRTVARPIAIPHADDQVNAVAKMGAASLMLFLFLSYSRIAEMWLPYLHLPMIASLLALAATLATGGVQRALNSKTGRWLTAFTIWLVIALPFSFWKTGSLGVLQDHWSKSFLTFIIVAGLLRSTRMCRAAMFTIAGGTMVVVLMCMFLGGIEVQGRLSLEQGLLANANDLSQLLLIGLPFLMLMAASRERNLIKRPLAAVFIPGVLLASGRTGSRGGLVAVAVLIVVFLMSISWANRAKLIIAVVMITLMVIPFVSTEQRLRYLTMFEADSTEPLGTGEISAVDSMQQRMALLDESIRITVEHPLVGVGPGVFQAFQAHEAENSGSRGMWRETHNTYTQISSEAGLPAFFFFLCALGGCLTTTRSIYKKTRNQPELGDVAKMAFCLWLSLIIYAVTAFFASSAYIIYLPMLGGFTVALSRSVQGQLGPTVQPARNN
jgi:O-antigen ligase